MRAMSVAFLVISFFAGSVHAEARRFSDEFNLCQERSGDSDKKIVCFKDEIEFQNKRLYLVYKKVSDKISPRDRKVLDTVQRDWTEWREGNYNFLSEHVAGSLVTVRVTSINFILNSVCDRADELETILDELGG